MSHTKHSRPVGKGWVINLGPAVGFNRMVAPLPARQAAGPSQPQYPHKCGRRRRNPRKQRPGLRLAAPDIHSPFLPPHLPTDDRPQDRSAAQDTTGYGTVSPSFNGRNPKHAGVSCHASGYMVTLRELPSRSLTSAITRDLDRLYLEHESRIRSIGYTMLPRTDVDDLVHDVVLHAAERLHQLRDPNSEATWIRTIAKTRALDRLRKQHCREQTCLEEHHHHLNTADLAAPDPADCAVAAATMQEERHRWARLDSTTQTALVLLADGATYREIAEQLDVPVPALKTRLHRGRRSMGRR